MEGTKMAARDSRLDGEEMQGSGMTKVREEISQAIMIGCPCEASPSNQPPLWIANFGEHGDTLAQFLLSQEQAVMLIDAVRALNRAIEVVEGLRQIPGVQRIEGGRNDQ